MKRINFKLNSKNEKIIIASAILVVVIVSASLIIKHFSAKKVSSELVELQTLTELTTQETTIEETETLSEPEAKTAVLTTKKKDVVKPAGTTKPVEKETIAPVVKQDPPKPEDNGTLHILDVPYINQRKNYPTGCESITAVMALHYNGYNISPENFIDNHLPQGRRPVIDETGQRYGDNPRECFLGSPYSSSGWGCYAPVIEKSLNEVINHSKHKITNVSGSSLKKLCSEYIDNGIPVIMWATQNMEAASAGKTWIIYNSGESFTWTRPNHCLLLVGYDDNNYYFNDPLQAKNYRYDRATVEERYASLGKQALVIEKCAPPETTQTTTEIETSQSETTCTIPNVSETTGENSTTKKQESTAHSDV